MATTDFLPTKHSDLSIWARTFKDGAQQAAATLGLSQDELTAIANNCDSIVAKVQHLNDATTAYHAAVKQVTDMKGIEEKALRALGAIIKTRAGYSNTLGVSLGLVGTPHVVDYSSYVASISVHVEGNMVRVRFKKLGVDGVSIYRRLKGSTAWTFVTRYSYSPYDDHITLTTPGVPEHWEYIAYGIKKDQEIGQPSAIQQIVLGATV